MPEEPSRNEEASAKESVEDELPERRDLEEEFLLSRLMEKALQQRQEKQRKRGKAQKTDGLVNDKKTALSVDEQGSTVEEAVTEKAQSMTQSSKKKRREHESQQTEPETIVEEEAAEASEDKTDEIGAARSGETGHDPAKHTEDRRYHKNRVLSRPEEREKKEVRARTWYESSIQAKKLAANGRKPRKHLLKHVKRMDEEPADDEEEDEEVLEAAEIEEECEEAEDEESVAHELISTRKRLVTYIAGQLSVGTCAFYLEHSVMIARPSLAVTITAFGRS